MTSDHSVSNNNSFENEKHSVEIKFVIYNRELIGYKSYSRITCTSPTEDATKNIVEGLHH